MKDFIFDFGTFNDTSVEVFAQTETAKQFFGKLFGEGAVLVSMPKSKAEAFADHLITNGFSID